jgi:uncharacterized protein YdeI (YjbR/CyaY-like superfamily)
MRPRFFRSGEDFRRWLEANHSSAGELWVGFYKKASSKRGITWSEAVDQALCFGWIDSVRKGIDDERRMMRFTPRKPRSIWSAVNIKKVGYLKKKGLMRPAGLEAFERRVEERSRVYSFEQENVAFDPPMEKRFRSHRKAWDFFMTQPPSYRRAATWWVISAKKEETRTRRLATLVEDSAGGRRIKHLTRS